MTETAARSPWPRAEIARWPHWDVVALGSITLLGLILRVFNLTAAPLFLDNLDELQFAWAGMNLILHGDAYTWSFFAAYPNPTKIHIFGETLPMVHQWMDHPPLYSLLVGGWVVLLGARHLDQVTAVQVRVIPILASSSTVLLTGLFARPILGRWPALIAAALLATAPAAVLLGRQSEPESVQAVLLLLALMACWHLTQGTARRRLWLIVACVSALLAPGMKISGVGVGGIALGILLAERQFRAFAWVLGATIAGVLVYPLYGALVNWNLFLAIVFSQDLNRQNVLTVFNFIAAPVGVNRPLHDGWWLLGWLGLLLLAVVGERRVGVLAVVSERPRHGWFLVWPAAAYTLVILILAGTAQTAAYGWYRIIIYPEVYLAAAGLVWWAMRRGSVGGYALVLGLGGATATNWLFAGSGSGWVPSPVLLVAILAVLLVPAVFATWSPAWRRRAQGVMAGGLVAVLLANIGTSLILGDVFAHM